jgi:hypothetical protein
MKERTMMIAKRQLLTRIKNDQSFIRASRMRRVVVGLAGVAIIATAILLCHPLRTIRATSTASVQAAGRDVDLTMSRIRFLPANPEPGQKVSVNLLIKNNGTSDSGPFKVAWFSNFPDSTLKPDIVREIDNLAPGSSIPVKGDYIFPHWGAYQSTGWVNYDGAVPETNFFNNIQVVSIMVSNLLIVDFTLLPDSSRVLETLNLKGNEFAAWGFHLAPDTSQPECSRAMVAIETQTDNNRLVAKDPNSGSNCLRIPIVFTFDAPVGGASVIFWVTESGTYTVRLYDTDGILLREGTAQSTSGEETLTVSVPSSVSALENVRKVVASGPGATIIRKIVFVSPASIPTATATAQAIQSP